MENIQFNYLYRDAGNYKKWARVIFSNPERLMIDSITEVLRRAFLDGELFSARQVRMPEAFLYTEAHATSDDHCFHEFDSVKVSIESPDDAHCRSISQFISEVKREAKRGWTVFNPHEVSL